MDFTCIVQHLRVEFVPYLVPQRLPIPHPLNILDVLHKFLAVPPFCQLWLGGFGFLALKIHTRGETVNLYLHPLFLRIICALTHVFRSSRLLNVILAASNPISSQKLSLSILPLIVGSFCVRGLGKVEFPLNFILSQPSNLFLLVVFQLEEWLIGVWRGGLSLPSKQPIFIYAWKLRGWGGGRRGESAYFVCWECLGISWATFIRLLRLLQFIGAISIAINSILIIFLMMISEAILLVWLLFAHYYFKNIL